MTATNPWDNWRPEIDGWSSDILPFYEALAVELPDGARCVEVGVYKGRSLIYLAEAFARNLKTAEIWGVDLFDASWCPDMWETFKGHVAATASPAREMIHVQRGPSNVCSVPGPFDLIFIDADHNYESVKADIAAWRGSLKPGGIMCGHDYSGDSYGSFPGVDRAVHEAFGKENILRPSGSVWRVK